MVDEEISRKYFDLYQRLHMKANDDISDDIDDAKPLFHTHTSDGIPIRKLFVANLAQRTTHKDLTAVFSKYGKVDSCYLKRTANKSNYAFITFSDASDAVKARCDGYRKEIRLHNRDLRVLVADSWHQPDSIECQNKLAQLKNKSTPITDEVIVWTHNEEDQSLINRLNDDCLMHIFQFLPFFQRVRIERVCKRWQTVSLNSWHNYRKLDVSELRIDTYSLRKLLLRCGQFLTSIFCSEETSGMSISTLNVICKLCPNIQKIDLSGITVTPSGITSLTTTYENLTELKLGKCSYLCDIDLKKLFQRNNKLRKLEIFQSRINGTCLLFLPETLEELVIIFCNDMSANKLCNALQRLKHIKRLRITNCANFHDGVLEQLSNCKELNSLVLSGFFPSISKNAFNNIARLTNLQELNVVFNYNLMNDTFLTEIATHCVNLTSIDISRCDIETAQGISKLFALPNLQHLKMTHLLVDHFNIDKNINSLKLKTLDCQHSQNLTDPSICAVIEAAPCLELLIINHCYKLTQRVLEVATSCTKKRTNGILLKLETSFTLATNEHLKDQEVSPLLHTVIHSSSNSKDEYLL